MNTKARELEAALMAYSNGTTQRKFRTKYFLARLSQVADAAFQGAVAGHALDHYDDLHIEHILPDTPNKRSEEHTSELQSLMRISYAVFCLKKKKITILY